MIRRLEHTPDSIDAYLSRLSDLELKCRRNRVSSIVEQLNAEQDSVADLFAMVYRHIVAEVARRPSMTSIGGEFGR